MAGPCCFRILFFQEPHVSGRPMPSLGFSGMQGYVGAFWVKYEYPHRVHLEYEGLEEAWFSMLSA